MECRQAVRKPAKLETYRVPNDIIEEWLQAPLVQPDEKLGVSDQYERENSIMTSVMGLGRSIQGSNQLMPSALIKIRFPGMFSPGPL